MDQEEALRQLACKWADLHKYVFNMVTWTGEDAEVRQSATATILIQVEKDIYRNGLPRGPTPAPEFKTADKIGKPDAPETVPGEQFTEEGLMGPAYDPVTKTWKYCPHCKRTDITHLSGEKSRHPGAEYQACFGCRVYLNIDGKEKDMGPARRGGA